MIISITKRFLFSNFLILNVQNCGFFFYSQQAKLFEERMSNVFGGVEGAPSGDQINMTFQKMAGKKKKFA